MSHFDNRGGRGGGYGGGGYGGGDRDGYGGGKGKGGKGKGGGRGGGGKNRHMGQLPSCNGLLRGAGMSDSDILRVVQPSAADLATRQAFYENAAPSADKIPPVENWRLSPSVGCNLSDANLVVRSNHFLLNTRDVPRSFYHYHLHLNSFDNRSHEMRPEDISLKEDYRVTVALMAQFRARHPEFEEVNGERVGFVYDSRSCVIATHELPLPPNDTGEPRSVSEELCLINPDGSESRKKYKLTLTYATTVSAPHDSREGWACNTDTAVIRSLDLSLLAFARSQLKDEAPSWYLVGNKCFFEHADSVSVSPGYVGLRGYTAGLKSCMAGLTLVSDMTVSVFLVGGPLVNVVAEVCGQANVKSFLSDAKQHRGIDSRHISKINQVLKNKKIRVDHLGHSRKFKELGPPADHRESSFERDGQRVTVADYFKLMARENPTYRQYMGGRDELQYPGLPTVNVGSSKHPILIPMELISVRAGQSLKGCTSEMTAKVVRHAAILPQERFTNLLGRDSQSALTEMRNSEEARLFGVTTFDVAPMSVAAKLLPPPKLQYRDEVFSPGLSGEWNIMQGRPTQFASLPPHPNSNGQYTYGIMLVGTPPRDWETPTKDFKIALEKDAKGAGLDLFLGGRPLLCSDRVDDIERHAATMKQHGARIVIVILTGDYYCSVKLAADRIGLMTQCLKWKNINKPPRGFHMNVMLKVNTKMGGTNHTLASRLTPQEARAAPATFQNPPASLSWVFDKPCMLVGIDTSHAEPGSEKMSMAAVVGSINGQASQYAAHISAQPPRVEMVGALKESMFALLQTFKSKNQGRLPEHMIIYRDGVSDGQFDQVLANELPLVQTALAEHGDLNCKIAFVVCQKRHHTRLVFEDKPDNYVNCCPGLCVDGSGKERSITSAAYNEFYLNSHTAIQGTAKACKYSLIYDDIGMKISELELLTYWSCYLYTRCNRSVSLATPCYYAHWASRRAKHLFTAGADSVDLTAISEKWSEEGRDSTMFFV